MRTRRHPFAGASSHLCGWRKGLPSVVDGVSWGEQMFAMLLQGGTVRRHAPEPITILGIDPGLAHTGWGVVEQVGSSYRCLAYGCVVTTPQDTIDRRLKQIYDEIVLVIERFHPTELGIEQVYFGVNTKTAFATGQARGVAIVACASGDLTVGEYTPGQIKQAVVGTGTADKAQVQYMVRAVLGLDHEPKPDHAADALAAAICQGNLREMRVLEQTAASAESRDASLRGTRSGARSRALREVSGS